MKIIGFATTVGVAMFLLVASVPTASEALTLKSGTIWETREIKVCWDRPQPEYRQERDLVRKAIAWTWERESAVRFTGWRKCRDGDNGIWVYMDNSYPRTAGRGLEIDGVRQGVVVPPLWSTAALSIVLKAPVHEFGHALGFGHEYARKDVTDPEKCGLLKDGAYYVEPDSALTPYDENSIMVGCQERAEVEFSLGYPELSPGDIFGLVHTYGSNPENVLDQDETGDLFGASIALVDLNRDGVEDLAVGAPGEDDGQGAVYLYEGTPRRGFRPWFRISARDYPGLEASTGFGVVLLAVPTDNADLSGHVVAMTDDAQAASFRVKVDRKKAQARRLSAVPSDAVTSTPLEEIEFAETTGSIAFPDLRGGEGMTRIDKDLNRDGIADTIVGAPRADGMTKGSGAVVILMGQADGRLSHWYWFGQSY